MGLFDFMFNKPAKEEDEFFGKLIFQEFKDNQNESYFECCRHFSPIDDVIEIGVSGDASGPSKKQKDFFRAIEANYETIIASIQAFMENEFKNAGEDYEITDFRQEFYPVYLYLPRCEKNPKIWEIAFEIEDEHNHIVTVVMHDFEAKEISIDD